HVNLQLFYTTLFRSHVLEVRRSPADDDAGRHDGIRAAGERSLCGHGQLERAGHPHQRVLGARGVQRALGAGDEAVGNHLVPGAGDDDDPQAAPIDRGVGGGCSGAAHASSFPLASAWASSASPMMWPMRSRLVSRYWWLLGPTPTISGTCSTTSSPSSRSLSTLSVLLVSSRTFEMPRSGRMPAAAA